MKYTLPKIDPQGRVKAWCANCCYGWVNYQGECPICGQDMENAIDDQERRPPRSLCEE